MHDANSLYELLENEIIPLFYQRTKEGLPLGWVEKMKASLASLAVRFSADRMVRDYVDQAYMPLMRPQRDAVSPDSS